MASNFRNQLEAYLKTLHIDAKAVLDVGGGANPVNERISDFKCGIYDILDLKIEPQKRIPEWNYDLNLPLPENQIEPYDVVFCLEVMEYIHNPHQAMVNLNNLLKPSGALFITFPFFYPLHQPSSNDFLRYTRISAVWYIQNAGFKITKIIPRTMTEQGFALYQTIIGYEKMHALKNWSHHNELGVIIEATK